MFARLVKTLILLLLVVARPGPLGAQAPEFMSLASARPVLEAMGGSLPRELKADAARWDQWVRAQDQAIRKRVVQGEELTLSNLLRLGVTYTRESRITFGLLDRYGHDAEVNATAARRADDLIRALSAPRAAEGLLEMRAFLQETGHRLDTPQERNKTRSYLLATLSRQRDDAAKERARARVDTSQAFRDRGLSTDSDLYTAYLLEMHLRNLAQQGLLKPLSVHRVAIVGPGLDFVNKKLGYDFYPPQVLQPYAVIDSLVRLGLAYPASIEVRTFDISPRVNRHIERARRKAAAGSPYTVQVLWSQSVGGSHTFLADFLAYWARFGETIGKTVDAIAVPEAARADLRTRAVSIQPGVVKRIAPVDMNVIFQAQPLPAEKQFDLAIGTNIFLYYDALQQALACVNLAAMIKPGGLLISNTPLPRTAPSKLVDSVHTDIPLRPGLGDRVYSYLRQP